MRYGTIVNGAFIKYPTVRPKVISMSGGSLTGTRNFSSLRKCSTQILVTVSRLSSLTSHPLQTIIPVHAWNYRRYVLASMPVKRPEGAELAYTKRKIEANFSNFSAWHQRSKVLGAMWSSGKLDRSKSIEEGMRKKYIYDTTYNLRIRVRSREECYVHRPERSECVDISPLVDWPRCVPMRVFKLYGRPSAP